MTFPDTRTREDGASFWARYEAPLAAFARRRFGLDPVAALDLARDFCLRELERGSAVHVSYVAKQDARRALWPPRGFRRFLCTAFARWVRDRLEKDRTVPLPPDLDAADARDEAALDRLVALELVRSVRDEAVAGLDPAGLEVAYFDARWPADLGLPVLSDREVARRLDVGRGQVRGASARVADALVAVVGRRIAEEGWSPEEGARILREVFGVLEPGSAPA